jgi:hypothetical protein
MCVCVCARAYIRLFLCWSSHAGSSIILYTKYMLFLSFFTFYFSLLSTTLLLLLPIPFRSRFQTFIIYIPPIRRHVQQIIHPCLSIMCLISSCPRRRHKCACVCLRTRRHTYVDLECLDPLSRHVDFPSFPSRARPIDDDDDDDDDDDSHDDTLTVAAETHFRPIAYCDCICKGNISMHNIDRRHRTVKRRVFFVR